MFSPIAIQRISFFFLSIAVVLMTSLAYYFLNPAWVTYRRAENLFQQKAWDQAFMAYEEAFNRGLKYPMAMVKLAEAAGEMKKYNESIFWYEKYLALFPKVVWVRKSYAAMLVADSQFDRASKEYELIFELEKIRK